MIIEGHLKEKNHFLWIDFFLFASRAFELNGFGSLEWQMIEKWKREKWGGDQNIKRTRSEKKKGRKARKWERRGERIGRERDRGRAREWERKKRIINELSIGTAKTISKQRHPIFTKYRRKCAGILFQGWMITPPTKPYIYVTHIKTDYLSIENRQSNIKNCFCLHFYWYSKFLMLSAKI